MMSDENDISMRILYLEKEVEKLQEYIQQLKVKLEINPYTRATFRERYEFFEWLYNHDVSTDITDNRIYSL